MTTATRAQKGGQVGINGEFYQGGTFLPSTKLTKMTCSQATKTARVAPFWQPVAALCARDANVMKITASDQSIAYFGFTREEVQGICDRYNGGER